jgi:hypothetical protein
MPNSRFKIQDLSWQKSFPEKQQITILYYSVARARNQNRVLGPELAPARPRQGAALREVRIFAAEQGPTNQWYSAAAGRN